MVAGARSDRLSARSTAAGPCLRTASPVSNSSTGPRTAGGSVGVATPTLIARSSAHGK
jgi:hypothetical protein